MEVHDSFTMNHMDVLKAAERGLRSNIGDSELGSINSDLVSVNSFDVDSGYSEVSEDATFDNELNVEFHELDGYQLDDLNAVFKSRTGNIQSTLQGGRCGSSWSSWCGSSSSSISSSSWNDGTDIPTIKTAFG